MDAHQCIEHQRLALVRPFITLTTDFGLSDPYVASLKGSIYSINPDASVIDVSHDVRPQRIEQAVFVLEYALPYLPKNSIHVLVVDPHVGTDRRAIALTTPNGTFVGPDNGLLSPALPENVRNTVSEATTPVALPPQYSAHLLTNDAYHREHVSATFHGRDVFAPVAAHLSLGVSVQEMGPPVSEVIAFPPFRAEVAKDASLLGRVVHVDRYGNLITNIRGEQLDARDGSIEVAGHTIKRLSRTYADAEGLTAVIASTGYLAIVVVNGNAASELHLDIGATIRVVPA
ncbi:MAG: S-adenosyl-l-methionine hydroxide adenosyltransferase family protein [Dehalococcoidia bacterium]